MAPVVCLVLLDVSILSPCNHVYSEVHIIGFPLARFDALVFVQREPPVVRLHGACHTKKGYKMYVHCRQHLNQWVEHKAWGKKILCVLSVVHSDASKCDSETDVDN